MSYVTLSYVILSKLSYVIRLMNILMEKGQNEKTMFKIKFGVKCLQCSRIFFDKSNLNRHSAKEHKGLDVKFESNVAYVEKDGVIRETCDWEVGPLPAVCFDAASAAPGCLERQTKYLSKAATMFSDPIWVQVSEPTLESKDSAKTLLDAIDDFALVASTVVRSQVMRSKSNSLKPIPFQPLKDLSGAAYAITLARFYVFAKLYFDAPEKELTALIHQATIEHCSAVSGCCLESFILCLAQVAQSHQNADVLQHAAMHMRRVLRGSAMLHLHLHPEVSIDQFCDEYLNMKKASSFSALSLMYYEIKRCVPHDKRLLIHRCDPDDGFPEGSAVLVDTGRSLQRVSWAMMRSIVFDTLNDITGSLNKLQLPGRDLNLKDVVDFEDSAIGSGLLASNSRLFSDVDQVDWLKEHCKSFKESRQTFETLQMATHDFLAGIAAHIGGGSRRMPELCSITLEVTPQNPTRGFRMFEGEGVLVGDYRKGEGFMHDPTEDLTLWVLPPVIACLLCRMIIYGKPLEVRLANMMFGAAAAGIHRIMLGAFNGTSLKSTKLGDMSNAALAGKGCPTVRAFLHVQTSLQPVYVPSDS